MATDSLTFEVDGLAELEEQLLRLEAKASEKIMRRALAKSARPTVRKAKALVPVRTGGLKQAIGIATRKGRGKNVASVFIGPKPKNKAAIAKANTGRAKPIKGVFYGHLVELGYGRQRPQPFLRPALDNTADQATQIFAAEIKRELESVPRG